MNRKTSFKGGTFDFCWHRQLMDFFALKKRNFVFIFVLFFQSVDDYLTAKHYKCAVWGM